MKVNGFIMQMNLGQMNWFIVQVNGFIMQMNRMVMEGPVLNQVAVGYAVGVLGGGGAFIQIYFMQ